MLNWEGAGVDQIQGPGPAIWVGEGWLVSSSLLCHRLPGGAGSLCLSRASAKKEVCFSWEWPPHRPAGWAVTYGDLSPRQRSRAWVPVPSNAWHLERLGPRTGVRFTEKLPDSPAVAL